MKAAKGKYIAICEGDDYWTDPNKLQMQVDFMEANPEYSMCFHNAYIEYENSQKPRELFLKKGFNKDLGVKEVIEYWYIPTASMMFRSEMMQYPDWLYKGFGLDRAMHVILAKNGPIKYIDKPMSVYRKHESSLTSRKMTEEIANANIQKYKNIENYLQGEHQRTINMMYVRYYFKLVKVYFQEKNYRNSWKYFWKAFALKPYKTMKFFLRFASGNY
jgi:glycosyltransferase involved in cell wall biosynthesis